MPGLFPPMSSSIRGSRRALVAIAMMISALTRAAEMPGADARSVAPPPGYVVAILAVTVNSEAQDEPVLALRDDAGRVLLPLADLTRWRMRLPAMAGAAGVAGVAYAGDRYIPLEAFPGVSVKIDERAQALTIDAPPSAFASTAIDALALAGPIPQRSATGGFLNYTLLATRSDEVNAASGSFEVGAFGRFGTATSTAVASRTAESTTFTRLDSTWTYAMPERLSTLRAGDAVSRGGAWGSAVRFGGVQFATDFATQPNLVLTAGQFASGQATVPSTVDVFINNALVTQQSVKPGPFSITNIPPITGSGNVTLIVRDELGREQIISRPFYASPTLLRPGLSDFSVDLGLVRENYGISSNDYGSWIAAGTYRRGLNERVTAEVRAEALAGLTNAGAAASMLVEDFGVFSTSLAGGHNPIGNGARFSIGFDRQAIGLSFGVQASFLTPRFRLAGDVNPQAIRAREVVATADYSLGRMGTVAVAYVDRAFHNQPSTQVTSLGYTVSLDRWGYLAVSASRVKSVDVTTMANVLWTFSLGPSTSAAASLARVRGGDGSVSRDERTLSVQRNLPPGEGWGYRVLLSDEGSQQGQLNYQNRYGTYSAEIARSGGQMGERISASGGLGVISGRTFLSRSINDSFGLVRVPGYSEVRIYAQNREIGRTDANGELIVPRLLPYQRNRLSIDQSDLPLDAEFDGLTNDAVPYGRSGVVVDFAIKPAHSALVRIVQPDGQPVPAGAQVRVAGRDQASPVALDGQAYLTDLSARNRAVVTWTQRTCEFDFEFLQNGDPQPRLGPFVCTEVRR